MLLKIGAALASREILWNLWGVELRVIGCSLGLAFEVV
jgi:hypothetical protein